MSQPGDPARRPTPGAVIHYPTPCQERARRTNQVHLVQTGLILTRGWVQEAFFVASLLFSYTHLFCLYNVFPNSL